MKRIHWRDLAIPLFAIIVVAFLVLRSLPIYLGNHQQYQQVLGLQREEKALLCQELLKSRYELFFSYDPLVAYLSDLKNLQKQLQPPPPFTTAHRRQFEVLLEESQAELEQVEQLL